MSSGQALPNVPAQVNQQHGGGGRESAETMAYYWPAQPSLAYDNIHYQTPFPFTMPEIDPSLNIESTLWPDYTRTLNPGFVPSYDPQPMSNSQAMPPYIQGGGAGNRFSSSTRSISLPDNLLGFDNNFADSSSTLEPTHPPTSLPQRSERNELSRPRTLSPPGSQHVSPSAAPAPRRLLAKRSREEEEDEQSAYQRRRMSAHETLTDQDRGLLELKEEGLQWKEIAPKFNERFGTSLTIAALQMRHTRIPEKYRIWEPQDVEALRAACEEWERTKWDTISDMMLARGATTSHPAKACKKKWQELASRGQSPTITQSSQTPNQVTRAVSQLSSPPSYEYSSIQ